MDSATIRRIAVAADDTHPETVKKYLAGQTVRATVVPRIERGLRATGLERLIRSRPDPVAQDFSPRSRA